MRIALFYHSLLSDWNHGNAHFLRGIASELISRGHDVEVFEPADSWSLRHLISSHGERPVQRFHEKYPALRATRYTPDGLDLDDALDGADLVIVHEWNDPVLVRRIGEHRKSGGGYRLLFHDTHHRMITAPESMVDYDLTHFDGVLAYGEVLKRLYLEAGRASRAWTWHEAADTRIFHPFSANPKEGDLIWIGNWGDDERGAELQEFLIGPCRELGIRARVHGVRYPETAIEQLAEAGLDYAGWLPNYEVPSVFAAHRVTVHIPRRPYVEALPGIPTIRVFEALACGIPLVCSPWDDAEGLFQPGRDYLIARNGEEMMRHLRTLLQEPEAARALADHGVKTIRERHTCRHRVEELLAIYAELQEPSAIGALAESDSKVL